MAYFNLSLHIGKNPTNSMISLAKLQTPIAKFLVRPYKLSNDSFLQSQGNIPHRNFNNKIIISMSHPSGRVEKKKTRFTSEKERKMKIQIFLLSNGYRR
jgi:hypothetical protein